MKIKILSKTESNTLTVNGLAFFGQALLKGRRINKCPNLRKYFSIKQGGKIRITPKRNKGFVNAK